MFLLKESSVKVVPEYALIFEQEHIVNFMMLAITASVAERAIFKFTLPSITTAQMIEIFKNRSSYELEKEFDKQRFLAKLIIYLSVPLLFAEIAKIIFLMFR